MFDLVISGGDSFTFGAELTTDNSVEPNPNSWANLVAARIGKQHVNVARSGRSNSYTVRHILHQIEQSSVDHEKIFVQVMWTFADRSEFAVGIPLSEYDSPWLALTPFSHVDESESDWFRSVSSELPTWKSVYNSLKTVYNRNRELGIVDFAQQYNRLIQSSPLNDSYTSVKEVLLLQNFLQLHQIPYLFTYVNQHVMNGLFDDASRGPGSEYLGSLRAMIDHDRWYRFPGDHQQYVGFDDWAKVNNYEYATSHPLEPAHAAAADLIYNELVGRGIVDEK